MSPRVVFLILFSALVLSGCSALGRKVNQALPEFLRADPGADEMARYEQRRRTLNRSPEEAARARADFESAKALFDAKQYEDTIDAFETYLESYPDTPEEREARFMLITALIEEEEVFQAQKQIKEYFKRHPLSDYNAELEKITYEFSVRLIDGDYDAFIFSKKNWGIELCDTLVLHFPNGVYADDALWRVATYHFDDENWIDAQVSFETLVKNYPESPWAGRARYNLGLSQLNRIKGPEYDSKNMEETIESFRLYLARNPEGDRRDEAKQHIANVRELLGEKQLVIARYYIWEDAPRAARMFLLRAIRKYPETRAAETAEAMMADLPAETAGPPTIGAPTPGEATPPARPPTGDPSTDPDGEKR